MTSNATRLARVERRSSVDISQIEAAYLAGLFDGEGCVGIYSHPMKNDRDRKTWHLSVSVGSSDEATTLAYKEKFGGCIKRYSSDGSHRKRTHWSWECQGEDARFALETMLPFLRYKNPQAVEALRFTMSQTKEGLTGRYAARQDGEFIAGLARNIRAMKFVGVNVPGGSIKGLRRVS